MRELDQYLERKGAKYFVALTMIFYVIGTGIFNIYLRSLGIAEFDLVKLRYMFVGLTFVILSAVPVLLFFGIRKLVHIKKLQGKKLTKRQKTLFWNRFEKVLIILILPWIIFYSLYVFPLVPTGFGGAKPFLARLVGQKEQIRGINELIAFETGVPLEKLAFELASENSDLAIGANVLVLDNNPSRIFLLLTKDLYLQSTSRLAKDLIESGASTKDFQIESTKDFQLKPLIVDARKVEGFTLSLAEPPEVLTREDLAVAAAAISSDPQNQEKTTIVSNFFEEKAPNIAPQVIQLVKEKAEQREKDSLENTTKVPDIKDSEKKEPVEVDNTTENIEDARDLVGAIEKIVDTAFLDFREKTFQEADKICYYERGQKNSKARLEMVKSISETFEKEFPEDWRKLQQKNYLANAQGDEFFPCVVSRIFERSEHPSDVIKSLNNTEPEKGITFFDIMDGALELLDKSSKSNTPSNRKYVSQVLIRYFSQKARTYATYWNESKYLQEGRNDEAYFKNIRLAMVQSKSWESLKQNLERYYENFEAKEESSPPEFTGSGSSVE